jgi:hypothetical protein
MCDTLPALANCFRFTRAFPFYYINMYSGNYADSNDKNDDNSNDDENNEMT